MQGILNPDPLVKPFVEHLEDMRRAVIMSACFFAAGLLIALPLAPYVFAWLRLPYVRSGLEDTVALRVVQVGGGLSVMLRIVFWSGLLFSLPFVLGAAGVFVLPGLSRRERLLVLKAGGVSVALFALGVLMAHRWTVPVALRLMSRIETWMGTPAVFWETPGYVSFVLRLLLAFGAAFQFPILVVVLGTLGIVSLRQLREKRRHVVVGVMVVAMLMTPPDPLTMILMGLPLIVLYEISLWVVWLQQRHRPPV